MKRKEKEKDTEYEDAKKIKLVSGMPWQYKGVWKHSTTH